MGIIKRSLATVSVSALTLGGVFFPDPRAEATTRPGLETGGSACLSGGHPSLADRAAQVAALRDSIERSLVRTDPNATFRVPPGKAPARVFNGSFDWHSSVHAHWALLSIARLTADAELESRVLARLSPAALSEEAGELLRAGAGFEMPYGQAWLLLLLRELGRRPGGLGRDAGLLRMQTESRLLKHLESSPFPEGGRNSASFSRKHSSWLFSYMLFRLAEPLESNRLRIDRLGQKLESLREGVLQQTLNGPRDFVYLPAALWLAENFPSPSAKAWAYRFPVSAWPTAPVAHSNAHQAGGAMVSLWPFAAQSAEGDRASCETFNLAIDRMMAQPEYWRFDPALPRTFDTVGHWVPQFAWMGIALEQGEL